MVLPSSSFLFVTTLSLIIKLVELIYNYHYRFKMYFFLKILHVEQSLQKKIVIIFIMSYNLIKSNATSIVWGAKT